MGTRRGHGDNTYANCETLRCAQADCTSWKVDTWSTRCSIKSSCAKLTPSFIVEQVLVLLLSG